MDESLFLEFVAKYFPAVVGKITEKINDKKTEETLLHKTMLTEEYSADLTWGSTELGTAIVAADVVALDSSLPLKKRDKITTAIGTIPKLGMKFRKGEKDISDINVMIARGANEATVVSKIFSDAPKVIKGIDMRKEIMFQAALSTGVTLIEDDTDKNVGTGIRVAFGYKAANTFHAKTAKWSESTATPQDDVQQMFDKAEEDGNTIGLVLMTKKYFNYFRNSTQGKRLAARFLNQNYDANTILSVPSKQTFIDALADEYGCSFKVVNSSFRVEKPNGDRVTVKPWEEGNIVGVPSKIVGRLVYGTLAEETNPVNCVNYEKSGTHILISKYSKNDPLEEFTAGQALCFPVIDGVDGIYILHADGTGVVSVTPTTLSFAASANTTGKKVTVHADTTFSAAVPQADSWVTLVTSGEEVTVKVSANVGAERTSTLTITDANSNTATVAITQAAAAGQ